MIRVFNVHYPLRTLILPFGEVTIAAASLFFAVWLRFGNQFSRVLLQRNMLLQVFVVPIAVWASSYFHDLYSSDWYSSRGEVHGRILSAVGVLAFLLAALTYLLPAFMAGNGVLPLGLIILTVGLVGWRQVYYWLVRQSFFRERVYVLGCDERTLRLVQNLRSIRDSAIEVVNWQDAMGPPVSREELAERIGKLKHEDIHRVIVGVSDRRGIIPVPELLTLRFMGIKVEYAAALFEQQSGKIEIDDLSPSWLIFADGFRLSRAYSMLRTVGSAMMSLLFLVLVVPLVPLIILTIKLTSKGPIIYRQARVGLNGTIFHCYKFRTMHAEAEADTGPTWAGDDDPRITKVGRFLRRTRLDEIPQLWNLLRGDMSFVGPRPERPEFVAWLAQEIPYYQFRHVVRPGLTGWAQIRYKYGNSVEDAKEKLKYDLYYIKNISVGLDVLIFLQTLKVVLFGAHD
jgi:sugar transferase (PEP-CTERM system associated)